MTAIPENKETFSSHIPALHILMAMGYEYLPPEACLAKRGKNSEVLLDENHETYDAHQKTREDFYEALTEYGMCLKVALSSRSFYEDAGFAEYDAIHIDPII